MKPFNQLPEALTLTSSINAKTAATTKITEDIDGLMAQAAQGHQADDHSGRVQAALEYAATGEFVVPNAAHSALHEKINYLRQQVQALDVAIKADYSALRTLQSEASAAASAEAEAKHKAIAADALKAIRAFDSACVAEQALVAELGAAGFDARFRQTVQWPHAGRLQDISASAVWHYERGLAGYVGKTK